MNVSGLIMIILLTPMSLVALMIMRVAFRSHSTSVRVYFSYNGFISSLNVLQYE